MSDLIASKSAPRIPQEPSLRFPRSTKTWRGMLDRTKIGLLIGLLVSGGFLYLVLRSVDIARMWQLLCSAAPLPLALAMFVGAVSCLFRALRWGVLISSPHSLRLRHLFTSMMIGYLANNVLPARMGELVRIHVMGRKGGVSRSTLTATVILERLLDAILLLALVAILSIWVPMPHAIRPASPLALAGFTGLILFLALLAINGESLVRQATRAAGSLSRRLGAWLEGRLQCFVIGFRVLHSPMQCLKVLVLTLIIWGMESTSVWLVMHALQLDLPWLTAPFLLGVVSLSFLLPSAPSGVGTYEFFVMMAVSPFLPDESRAVGFALVLHALAFFTSTSLGLFSLGIEGLSIRELVRRSNTLQQEAA